MQEREYYTARNLINILQISEKTFYKWIKDGKVPLADDTALFTHRWWKDNPKIIKLLNERNNANNIQTRKKVLHSNNA